MRRSIGVLMLHPGCNMRCRFCITSDAMTAMRYNHAMRALDRIQAAGMNNLVLGGGEPFTWEPGVVRLAWQAKQRGLLVQIGTNGVLMPPDYARLACIDRYVLPLESVQPAPHDRMRRMHAGSHHAVILKRLDELAASGKSVTVSTVVTAENLDGLGELAVYLSDYALSGARLHAWHLYQFIPEGRGGACNARALRVSEAGYDAACAAVKAMNPSFTVFKRKDMRHSRTVDFFWQDGETLRTGSETWTKPGLPRGAGTPAR